jgi:hypothetical protein
VGELPLYVGGEPGCCPAPLPNVPLARNVQFNPGIGKAHESYILISDVSQRASETTSSCTHLREQRTSAKR